MSATDEHVAEGNGGEDIDGDDLIFVSEERIDPDEAGYDGTEYPGEGCEEAYDQQAYEDGIEAGIEGDLGMEGNIDGEELDGEEEGDKEGEKGGNAKGGEGMMVVDEWDEGVESDLEDEETSLEVDEATINPELKEKLVLSMPSHKTLLNDIGHLKQNRRVIVEPLTVEELRNDRLLEWASSDHCTEFKIQFLKSSEDEVTWKGIAVLHFRTCNTASNAAEALKEIRSDLSVKIDTNTNQAVEQFCKNTRNEKRWPDNVVLIRHLHVGDGDTGVEAATEFLKAQCSDVEQIIIHMEHSSSKASRATTSSKDKDKEKDKDESKDKESSSSTSAANKDEKAADAAATKTTTATSSSSSSGSPRGYAYLVFVNKRAAEIAVQDFDSRVVEYEGHRLIAQLYEIPADIVPRGLLKLRERRAVMNHMEKVSAKIEKAKADPASVKLPEKAEDRVKKCKDLIDRDNRARKELNLPAHSLEELRALRGLPVMSAADCQKLLIHLGVISRKPDPKDKDRDSRRDSGRRHGSSRSRTERSSGGGRSARSPPRRSKRGSWGGNRNQRSGGRVGGSSSGMGGGGIAGIGGVNPLAQLMLQQNLGMIGGGTGLNPVNLMSLQPGANLLANANLLSSQRAALGGSMGFGSNASDPNKVLRLDEMGNFRADDGRYGGDDYGRRRSRDDLYESRGGDRGHFRSRSPHYDQGSRRLGGGRDNYGSSPPRRTSDGSGQDNPVNLLLNLSQMLSQKIEQKRGALDRDKRGYDRDYHGGRR